MWWSRSFIYVNDKRDNWKNIQVLIIYYEYIKAEVKSDWITWLHKTYERVCILYTEYVHWFWKWSFCPCKFNTKNYLQKVTVGTFSKGTITLEAPARMKVLKKDLIQYCTSRQTSEVWKMHFTRTWNAKWIKKHYQRCCKYIHNLSIYF